MWLNINLELRRFSWCSMLGTYRIGGATLSGKQFFDERRDQSEVKARIIQKYFYAWANVVMPTASAMSNRIAYIDLYAGPGRYRDGSASTPLLVLEHAIAHPKMSQMLVALFNDADGDNTATLAAEIAKLPGIEKLKHKPSIQCNEVNKDAEDYFARTRLIPSFTFFDPFGYKGLSLKIVNGVIKDWGCDCVFFFNYSRINAGISNPKVIQHMDALFGEERANKLRAALEGRTPQMREALILEEMAQALKGMGGKFVLPFLFKSPSGNRTSHSLVFVTKHFKGYSIMKDIMAKESSTVDQGVPSFTYSPADASTPLLLGFLSPFEKLEASLLETFSGDELCLQEVYEHHSVDTNYVLPNYRDVINDMEERGVVTVFSETGKRRGKTFPEHVKIRFL